MRLYSDWLLPKKKEPTTSNREISEDELAEKRLMKVCEKMEEKMKIDYRTLA